MGESPKAASPEEADASVLRLTVNLSPESGLYIANLYSQHPKIVKAYRLAEVLKPIWDALAADDCFKRWPSDIAVDLHYREVWERNDRLAAEMTQFTIALDRIMDIDHPAGCVETLAQAREVAAAAFKNASSVGRDRLAAARAGAFAQTEARTDRDLSHRLDPGCEDVMPCFRRRTRTRPVTRDAFGARSTGLMPRQTQPKHEADSRKPAISGCERDAISNFVVRPACPNPSPVCSSSCSPSRAAPAPQVLRP